MIFEYHQRSSIYHIISERYETEAHINEVSRRGKKKKRFRCQIWALLIIDIWVQIYCTYSKGPDILNWLKRILKCKHLWTLDCQKSRFLLPILGRKQRLGWRSWVVFSYVIFVNQAFILRVCTGICSSNNILRCCWKYVQVATKSKDWIFLKLSLGYLSKPQAEQVVPALESVTVYIGYNPREPPATPPNAICIGRVEMLQVDAGEVGRSKQAQGI